MKYFLFGLEAIIMVAYLIIERLIKVLVTILVFIWDFDTRKEKYAFWDKVHYFLPIPGAYRKFDSIKDYFSCPFKK